MKPQISERIEERRIAGPPGERAGAFILKHGSAKLKVLVSDGLGWDHVSVSLATRCPTWEEMCWVKDQFFEPEECVMQLHPAKSEYVNYHQFCLHLWRPQSEAEMQEIKRQWELSGEEYPPCESPGAIPVPASILVGPKARTA